MNNKSIIQETKNRLLIYEAQLDMINKMCHELKADIKCYRNDWLEDLYIEDSQENKTFETKTSMGEGFNNPSVDVIEDKSSPDTHNPIEDLIDKDYDNWDIEKNKPCFSSQRGSEM